MSQRDRTIDAVTVVVPTYNESAHIDAVLQGLAAQTIDPSRLEVLVIDGGSTDDTVARANAHAESLSSFRILDNPRQHQSAALNIGLAEASHDFIVRMDAHTTYEPTYVAACVAAYEGSDAVMVGGPMRPQGLTTFGEAVALATTTPIGVGPGRFHYSEERELVDTVYLGAFDRRDIVELGGYDERSLWSEDMELALRITESGGRILLDPEIRSTYFPRSTPRALARQYARYAIGKTTTLRKHGKLPTWRPLAPTLLVALLVAAVIGLLFPETRAVALAFMVAYTGAILLAAAVSARFRPATTLRVFTAFATMHISYGIGFWFGLARWPFLKNRNKSR